MSRSRGITNSANSFMPAHDKPKDYKLEDRNLPAPRNLQVPRPWHVYGISLQQQTILLCYILFQIARISETELHLLCLPIHRLG